MKTQHTIKSLTDNKEIALSSKDLCKIVEYAIENDIVQIDIGVPNSKSMFSIKDGGVFYICSEKIKETEYDPSLFGSEVTTSPAKNKNVIDGTTYDGDDIPLDLPTFRN